MVYPYQEPFNTIILYLYLLQQQIQGHGLTPLPPPLFILDTRPPPFWKFQLWCLHWVFKKNTVSTLGKFKRFFWYSCHNLHISIFPWGPHDESSINLSNYSVNSLTTSILIMNSISWGPQQKKPRKTYGKSGYTFFLYVK